MLPIKNRDVCLHLRTNKKCVVFWVTRDYTSCYYIGEKTPEYGTFDYTNQFVKLDGEVCEDHDVLSKLEARLSFHD